MLMNNVVLGKDRSLTLAKRNPRLDQPEQRKKLERESFVESQDSDLTAVSSGEGSSVIVSD